MPVFSSLFLIVTLSSIALPLMNGFVGEFLILVGTFTSSALPHARLFTAFAATGMILSAVYMLWMFQRVVFGEVRNPANAGLIDVNGRERLALAPMIALIFVMGVYPSLFLTRSSAAIEAIKSRVNPAAQTVEMANRSHAGEEIK
jgi:NADH-quinone oxidoreductase subunit M